MNGLDEGDLHRQVDAFVFQTFDAGRQGGAVAGGDRDPSVMELEAADEGSNDGLVLKQSKLHANADSRSFREGNEATPATAHLVCGRETALPTLAVLGFNCVTTTYKPASRAEGISVAKNV